MADDDVAGRALRAARSNLVAFPLLAICALTAGVVVARVLPVSEFAIYAFALGIRGSVQFLADLGTGAAAARAFAQLEVARRRGAALRLYARLSVARVAVAALLAAVALVFAGPLEEYLALGDEAAASLTAFVVMCAAEIVAGLGTYVLTGTLHQRRLNVILIAYNAGQPVLVIGAALAGLGLPGVLAALAVSSAAKAVALQTSAWAVVRGFAGDGEDQTGIARSFTRTAGAASTGKVAAFVHSRQALSPFALPAAGRAEFAVFALGYDLAHQVMALAAAPAGNVMPSVAAKRAHDREQVRRDLAPVAVSLLTAAAGLALVAGVTLPTLDGWLYGSAYSEMGRYVGPLLAVVALEIGLGSPASAMLLADDRLLRRYAAIRGVELACVAFYFGIGLSDLLVVTFVLVAVRGVTAITLLLAAQQAVGVLLPLRWAARLLTATAAATLAGIACAQLPAAELPRALVGGIVAAGVFVLLVRRLRMLGPAETALAARAVPAARPVVAWLAGDASGEHARAARTS